MVPDEGCREGEVAFADEEDLRMRGEGDDGLGLGGLVVVLFGFLSAWSIGLGWIWLVRIVFALF